MHCSAVYCKEKYFSAVNRISVQLCSVLSNAIGCIRAKGIVVHCCQIQCTVVKYNAQQCRAFYCSETHVSALQSAVYCSEQYFYLLQGTFCAQTNIGQRRAVYQREFVVQYKGAFQLLLAHSTMCQVQQKMGKRNISTTAPIFSRYDYLAQNIWRLSSVQFHF